MESFRETVKRVADIWGQMDDKTAVLSSLGFDQEGPKEITEAWIDVIDAINTDATRSTMKYIVELIKDGALREADFASVVECAATYAEADMHLLFMMIGRERGRLENVAAA